MDGAPIHKAVPPASTPRRPIAMPCAPQFASFTSI
jgi:hypothetical protein